MSVPRSKIVVVLFDSISLETCRRVSTFVLDALRELARDRQVIVFSQEEEVRAWAEHVLENERDQLVSLDRVPSA